MQTCEDKLSLEFILKMKWGGYINLKYSTDFDASEGNMFYDKHIKYKKHKITKCAVQLFLKRLGKCPSCHFPYKVCYIFTYLPTACQLPPRCSALRSRRMPRRHHSPVGSQLTAAPGPPQPDPPEPGHEPLTQKTSLTHV